MGITIGNLNKITIGNKFAGSATGNGTTEPQYRVFTSETGVKWRKGIRDGYIVLDVALTVTGFDGVENTDWKNVDKTIITTSDWWDNNLSPSILDKFLFLGYYANISGGLMPNSLGTDFLTVSGSPGSETYQSPQHPNYSDADYDLLWYSSGWQEVTTADLIGFDFTRTLVWYDDESPYQIRAIGILKSGVTLTVAEEHIVRDYFKLSAWWYAGPYPAYSSGLVAYETPTNIELTFSIALDPAYVPEITDFIISGKTISSVVVSGTKVTLTVTSGYSFGDNITVSYNKPVNNYLRSLTGYAVSSFNELIVSNNVPKVKVTGIAVANATPNQINITFNNLLDESSIPATSCFTVSGRTISSVTISQYVVTLTITISYLYLETITVSYSEPTSNKLKGTDGTVSPSFTGLTGINNVNADAAATSLFARMLTADGVEQTNARKANINKTIIALKAASLWNTQFDVLVVTRGKGSGSQLLNWISSSYNASAVANGGTLTQTDDVGINTDGTKSYINTNYSNGLYVRDDASITLKLSSTPASGIAVGSTNGSTIRTAMGGGSPYTAINGANYLNSLNMVSGYNCITRDGASSWDMHKNASTAHYTDASTGIYTTTKLFIFCLNSGGAPGTWLSSTPKLEFYAMGKSLSQANFLALQTIINAYIAAL